MTSNCSGKICYIEIPAVDIARSAEFYCNVFGWKTRQRGDGTTAFDDTVGEVSGTWVVDRSPAATPGLLVYIMVANVEPTIEAIVAAGGQIVLQADPGSEVVFAHFRDPAGNVLGIYQQPGLAENEAKLVE